MEPGAVSGVEGAVVAGFGHGVVPLNDPLIFTRHSWRAILAVSQAGVSSVICENEIILSSIIYKAIVPGLF